MRIDLHMHTKEHSSCSSMGPEEMAERALKESLDGIVITEHNALWDPYELSCLRKKFPKLKIFSGIEVTIAEGEHILVFGVLNPKAFYTGIPMRELMKNVREEGGVAIIAHPFRYIDYVPDEVLEHGLDGVEVMSCNILCYMKDKLMEFLSVTKLPGISCTDAHGVNNIGLFATDFFEDIKDEKDIAEAIRQRKYSLYANKQKIDERNRDMEKRMNLIHKLAKEGRSEDYIEKKSGIPASFARRILRGRDLRLFCMEY